jgi:accessory gene regulator B
MIYDLSHKIATALSSKDCLDPDEIEIITYGLFAMLSKIIYGLISLIIGIIFDCIIGSMCFYLSFLFVKKYSGGVHASTEQRCFCYSSISIFCSVGYIRLAMKEECLGWIVIIISFILSFFIMKYAPIQTKEKRIDIIERKRYARIARTRIVALWICVIVLTIAERMDIVYAIVVAVVLEGVLLLAGKKKSYVNCSNKTNEEQFLCSPD